VYLFLVLSTPAVYVALLSLEDRRRVWSGLGRAAQGAGLALPSLLLPAILRAALPAVYRAFPHYLLASLTDHLSLHAAVTAWWLAVRGYRTLEDEAGRRRWDDFFAFSCGFYTLAAAALALARWAEPDIYTLLALPVLRVAMVVLSSILMVVYFESYGVFRFLYAAAYVALPFLVGAITYLESVHYSAVAAAAAAVLLVLSLLAWRSKELF
jgi:hypothetical protein